MAGTSHANVQGYTIYSRGMAAASAPNAGLAGLDGTMHQMIDDKFKEHSQVKLEDEMTL